MEIKMDLNTLSDHALIEVIENPLNQEKPYKDRAITELDNRNLLPEKIKALAQVVNAGIATEVLMNDGSATEEVSMHKSNLLDEEEIRQIYIEQLEKYIKSKDQFRFNVWSYAIGGA